jgi:hypothetical protein
LASDVASTHAPTEVLRIGISQTKPDGAARKAYYRHLVVRRNSH